MVISTQQPLYNHYMQYLPSREAAKILGLHPTPSDDTPTRGSSHQSKPRADNDDMTSRPTSVIPNPAPPSAIAGSPATSRPETSNARSPSCNSSTPTLKSSPTLHQDSTTGARDLLPYWNDYIAAISSQLWLPAATGSPGSAQNSSSKSSSKTVANSWFSTSEISAPRKNSPRIYSPSLLSSLARANGLRRYRKKIQEDKNLPRPATESQA